MDNITFINESSAFLTASTIAHHYFLQGYQISLSAKVACGYVELTIFTDDGQLPELPAGLSYSSIKTNELSHKDLGTFFGHHFTFDF